MATNEQDFLDRIRASRMEDILRIAGSTPRTAEAELGLAERILATPSIARVNRALQPETPEEMAALLGGSFVAGPAMDVADIGLGALEGDPTRTLFGLAGLALPFVTGTQIRVGSRTLSGRAAEIFEDLLRRSPGSSHEELADVAQRRATVEAERAASAARQSPQREGIASLDPRSPDVPEGTMVYRGGEYPEERRARQQAEDGPQPEIPDEGQFTQIDLFGDVEDIPTSVQDASFRNVPIEDPAAREALTVARNEGTPDALTLVSEARPMSGETAETLVGSAIRQAQDPRSGDAFRFALQGVWGQGAEDIGSMWRVMRENFPDMPNEEFNRKFFNTLAEIQETEEVLSEIPDLLPFGPQAGRAQGVIRDNPVMSRGRLTGYPSPRRGQTSLPGLPGISGVLGRNETLFDEETGEVAQRALLRSELLGQQTPLDRAADRIIQRRAGNIDLDELPAMRAGDPDEDMLPVERLFDPEDAYDLRTERERLSELFGDDIPTSLDFNSIKAEMRMMDEFSDASDKDIIDAIRNALSTSSRPIAGRVGRATLETSGRNAAAHLMSGVDTGAASVAAGRRRRLLESGREVMQEADVLKLVEKYFAGEKLSPEEFQIAYSHIMSKRPNRNIRPRSFPLSSVQGSRGRRQRGSR